MHHTPAYRSGKSPKYKSALSHVPEAGKKTRHRDMGSAAGRVAYQQFEPLRSVRLDGPVKDAYAHSFLEGDRVAAPSRPAFPLGTVIRVMDLGFLLVRWDGDVLETAHHLELTKEAGSD